MSGILAGQLVGLGRVVAMQTGRDVWMAREGHQHRVDTATGGRHHNRLEQSVRWSGSLLRYPECAKMAMSSDSAWTTSSPHCQLVQYGLLDFL